MIFQNQQKLISERSEESRFCRAKRGMVLILSEAKNKVLPSRRRGMVLRQWLARRANIQGSAERQRGMVLISGLSIIEVLVVIFILSLVGIAVATFQQDVFSLNTTLSSSLATQDEVRKTLKMMTAEIRPLSPSSVGAYPIAEADPTSFIFYSNIDNDQLKERVRYFLDGTILKKGIIKLSGTSLVYNPVNEIISEVIHSVANNTTPIFNYYDINYDGTTPPLTQPVDISAVRLIKITIVIDKDLNKSPGPITLTTQVSMRNLMDNP